MTVTKAQRSTRKEHEAGKARKACLPSPSVSDILPAQSRLDKQSSENNLLHLVLPAVYSAYSLRYSSVCHWKESAGEERGAEEGRGGRKRKEGKGREGEMQTKRRIKVPGSKKDNEPEEEKQREQREPFASILGS